MKTLKIQTVFVIIRCFLHLLGKMEQRNKEKSMLLASLLYGKGKRPYTVDTRHPDGFFNKQ
jgi:hypothetical protein